MDLITGGLYQGQEKYIKENYVSSLELFPLVCYELKNGASEEKILALVLKKAKEVQAINALEIGAGMIPVDSFERELREVYGRIVCELSERSCRVIRLVCNIATVIK